MMKLLKIIFLLFLSFVLSGCPISSNSYFVRWWNGDVISKPSKMEKNIWDECYKELDGKLGNTQEERKIASMELLHCFRKKEKEYGVK